GGDEVFCGYTRYVQGAQRWRSLSRIPLSVRRAVANFISRVPPAIWERLGRYYSRPDKGASSPLPTRVVGLAELLSCKSRFDMNAFMMSIWRRPEQIVLGASEPKSVYTRNDINGAVPSMMELMMVSDL